MRIDDALERFVVQLEADGRSAHTIGQYRRHIRLLDRWLSDERKGCRIERIDHEELAIFLASPIARRRSDGTPKKATSTNALRTSLRCFFAYCEGAGYCARSPARLVRRARCGTPPPRALSKEEEKRLLKALGQASDRDRTLFGLMLRTGIRLGSALALEVEDVDLDRGELFLRHAKGDREHVVYVPGAVCCQLREWIGKRTSGSLFPITARHASRVFQGMLAAAGIRRVRGTHVLRHTFGTRIYRQTGDLLVTKEALGHRTVASSVVYARSDETRLRMALGLRPAASEQRD